MLENVIEKAFEGDDDQLADSIESIDQRALDKVNEFYETLCSENATFTLKTKDRQIICSNMDKVKYAVGRLKKKILLMTMSHYLDVLEAFYQTDETLNSVQKMEKI